MDYKEDYETGAMKLKDDKPLSVKRNELKECFKEDCTKTRNGRGLYCSNECRMHCP